MASLVGLGLHLPPGRPKALSFFVSVCLFVRRAFECQSLCADFARKALEHRNDFDIVGQEKVCSCASIFNFLRLLPTGDTTKCRSTKKWQNLGFFTIETKFGKYTVGLL